MEIGDEYLQHGLQYVEVMFVGSMDVQYCKSILPDLVHVQFSETYVKYRKKPERATQAGSPPTEFEAGGKVGSAKIIRSGEGG